MLCLLAAACQASPSWFWLTWLVRHLEVGRWAAGCLWMMPISCATLLAVVMKGCQSFT